MCIPHPISFPLFLLNCSLNFLQNSNDTKKTNTKSSRPDRPEDRCPFHFCLYYHLTHKRWCIAKESSGCNRHHGHIPLALDEVHLSTTRLSQEALERITNQLTNNIGVSSIRAQLLTETGCNLTPDQVKLLRSHMVIKLTGSTPGECLTPAERLMRYLKDSDDIRYVALTATKDRGSLITIRTSKKDRYTTSDDTPFLNDGIQDHEDNPVTFAEQAIKALTLQDKETLLLGVAWITEEGT
jgi:hypothetical protein